MIDNNEKVIYQSPVVAFFAKTAYANSGQQIADHIEHVLDMLEIGSRTKLKELNHEFSPNWPKLHNLLWSVL